MSNGKKIGNAYEREVAKKLSKWITGSEEKLICWRNTHSGSIGTIRKKNNLEGDNVSGDFQCLDSNYEYFFNLFNIDSKSYSDINLCFINEKNIKSNKIFLQWIKTVKDAGNKIPIMIVKDRKNRKIPELVFFQSETVVNLENLMRYYIVYEENFYHFQVCTLDEFFKKNTHTEFYQVNKNFVENNK